MVVFTRRAFTTLKESIDPATILTLRDASDDDIQQHSQFLYDRRSGEKKFYMSFTDRLDLMLFWKRIPSGDAIWIVEDAVDPANNAYRNVPETERAALGAMAPFVQPPLIGSLFTLDDALQLAPFEVSEEALRS